MKKAILFFLLACASFSSYSQSHWYYYAEEFYFVKEVPVKDFKGKNFRYEIAVKANPYDTLSKVRVHGINVGAGREEFISSDFTVETRNEQDWIIYTVAGSVDDKATRLWFYTAVNGNGRFNFDDISFYVELESGQWKQLPLSNNSFETKNKNIFEGYYVSKRGSSTLTTEVSADTFKTGKHSLQVTSRKQQSVSLLTTTNE
ncbi:MAG: hypothetical protein H7Y31_03010 [Chitinophagaceae bacterium]|nr:hypothetical protein [Chitinophagaceae bacterium]